MQRWDLIPTIWSISTWATEQSSISKPSSPPKEEYKNRYYDFIKAFIERYDNDGFKDMVNLKYAHNYLVIEDEAQNLGDSWIAPSCSRNDFLCAAEKYGEMLKLAYNAAHEANPDSIVVSFSFNPGDYFDNNYNIRPPETEPKIIFLNKVFTDYWNYFDVIAIQANYDYTGIPNWIRYINATFNLPKDPSMRKPIISADTATMPMLLTHQFYEERFTNNYPYLSDREIMDILYSGDIPSNSEYDKIKLWWEAEKARLSVKKAIVSANSGATQVSFQFFWTPDNAANSPWSYSGMISSGGNKKDGPEGTPRAVIYALTQLIEQIEDFSKVENLNPIPLNTDPYEWLWLFKADDTLIVWNESGSIEDFTQFLQAENVEVTQLITELDESFQPIFPLPIAVPTNQVPIGNTPVFIKRIRQ